MMLSAQCSNVNRKQNKYPLVLFPGSLGDLVCALPALEEIQKRQNHDLVLAVRGEAFGLGSFLPFVTEVRSLEERVFSQLFSPPKAFHNEARDFFSSFSPIISWYGHSHVDVRENLRGLVGDGFCSFPFFIGQEDCHATAYYLRCVGVETLQCPVLQLNENAVRWRKQYWQQHGLDTRSRMLLLHPGSGGKKKRWELEGFRQVACWWQQECLGKCLVLLGPAEEGEVEQWRDVGDVETGLSLWQVAALLSRADLYLGNDSGVSHVAGAVGARGVVLFGPTRPSQWKPLGGNLSVVRNIEYREEFPATEGISLQEIPEEQVIERLLMQVGFRDLPFPEVKPYIELMLLA
jgi:ADP-heptose:LPS heptosyltransferase